MKIYWYYTKTVFFFNKINGKILSYFSILQIVVWFNFPTDALDSPSIFRNILAFDYTVI